MLAKEKKNQFHFQLSSSNKLKTMIGAIGQDGFLAFKCMIGSVNQFLFAEFLSELLSLLHHTRQENDYGLILDNATIHKSQRIQKYYNSLIIYIYHLIVHNQIVQSIFGLRSSYS
ncbi:unnamed protein product [Paramecium primaurelia]|uniref:Tc1-like transposase DDE domain-containing protein n=1 Tax=Paramecium primaurelia TaxID=5886 RepID=A0A8S1LRX3_PARPR|nr:unnamed protein product [Paramecium primaurelia]